MAEGKTIEFAGVKFNVGYMVIWGLLLFLTVVEVVIPEVTMLSRSTMILSLISLAIAKTYLVAWFYMHLVDERPMLVLVASAPFIFSVFLTIGLFPWPR